MDANVMNKVNVFANEFISTIIEEQEPMSSGYEWEISFSMGMIAQGLSMETLLFLYNGDGEEVGHISYEVIRSKTMKYTYTITFLFNDVYTCDGEDEFEVIKDFINSCEDGLYGKICAYLHRYTMEKMDIGEDVDAKWPPKYKDCYSPSRINDFMEKYTISPYVPIVMEVVDNNGMPMKYLSIKGVCFNDESNMLVISLKE